MTLKRYSKKGGVGCYALSLMLIAFLQSRVFQKKSIEKERPNLGILFIEFFNLFSAMKLQTVEIRPFTSDQLVESYPFVSKSLDFVAFQLVDPLNAKNNVAKHAYNFLFLENLFYFVFITLHKKKEDGMLGTAFETARLFQQLSSPNTNNKK